LFRLFRRTENSRNFVPNHSADDKNAWNSVLRNKIRSKRSQFRSVEEKTTQNSVPWNSMSKDLNSVPNHSGEETITRNSVPKHVLEENMLSILFAGARFFVKLIFFMKFPSVPSFGIDSSVNLGMPRNEHFLLRNNRSCSESIPRNFFGRKFRCQP
jgi:hypothetical protein